jgi:hypothetical protein
MSNLSFDPILFNKGECWEKFKEFKALVKKQSEHKIKVFRSDNGGEYKP